jgi:hypothetical protein
MTAQAPVLLLDTCSLLDLMRDPTRETFNAEQVQAAHHLLVKAESRPPKLWIPIAGQVLAERHEHQLNVSLCARISNSSHRFRSIGRFARMPLLAAIEERRNFYGIIWTVRP